MIGTVRSLLAVLRLTRIVDFSDLCAWAAVGLTGARR